MLVASGTGEPCNGGCGHQITPADKAFHVIRSPTPAPPETGSVRDRLLFDSRSCLVEHLKVRPEPEYSRLASWAGDVLPETP